MNRLLIKALLVLAAAYCFAGIAQAESPPAMPLPDCVLVDGEEQGACPDTNEYLTGTATGAITAGGSITINTVPTVPVCNEHFGYPPYDWNPSPCYSGVDSPAIVSCGVIDMTDGNKWKEMSCADALYQNGSDVPSPFLVMTGPDDAVGCGAQGNYGTYIYGGPANVDGATWAEFGPAELDCKATFNGTRPNGLYGPTWMKIRVGIYKSENGDERRGYIETAETFIPVDGDLRDFGVDVSVLATHTLEGSGDDRSVRITATLTNQGNQDTEPFDVTFELPDLLHFQIDSSDGRCESLGTYSFVGGNVICRGIQLNAAGDELDNDTEFLDVVARILNVADFDGDIKVEANAPEDIDSADNVSYTFPRPETSSGTISDTTAAMAMLNDVFDYTAPAVLEDKACNDYMLDIFKRFQEIHYTNPGVFEDLSYGLITSGDYYWAPVENRITRAGHVGVVVYKKGTNYHETGVVVHGTPTWSPTDLDIESIAGTLDWGEHLSINVLREGTADHLLYYRTPIKNFPGSAKPEQPIGCGFEGQYSDNGEQFQGVQLPQCTYTPPAETDFQTCGYYPDVTMIRTQSPVEILLTNSKGQHVQTLDGKILMHEFDQGIHSFPTQHEDGTWGWVLALPKDDYDIELQGVAEGSYTLTVTTFDENGEAEETVYEGETTQDQINTYQVADADPNADPNVDDGEDDVGSGDNGADGDDPVVDGSEEELEEESGGSSGSGANGWMLFYLLCFAFVCRKYRRR